MREDFRERISGTENGKGNIGEQGELRAKRTNNVVGSGRPSGLNCHVTGMGNAAAAVKTLSP